MLPCPSVGTCGRSRRALPDLPGTAASPPSSAASLTRDARELTWRVVVLVRLDRRKAIALRVGCRNRLTFASSPDPATYAKPSSSVGPAVRSPCAARSIAPVARTGPCRTNTGRENRRQEQSRRAERDAVRAAARDQHARRSTAAAPPRDRFARRSGSSSSLPKSVRTGSRFPRSQILRAVVAARDQHAVVDEQRRDSHRRGRQTSRPPCRRSASSPGRRLHRSQERPFRSAADDQHRAVGEPRRGVTRARRLHLSDDFR